MSYSYYEKFDTPRDYQNKDRNAPNYNPLPFTGVLGVGYIKKPWTSKETKKVIEDYQAGISLEEIAKISAIRRPVSAFRGKLVREGVYIKKR